MSGLEKRQNRAAEAVSYGLQLLCAGKQKMEECFLELGDMPQTQGVRDTRRRLRIIIDQTENSTRNLMRAMGKSELVEQFEEESLDSIYGS